MIKRYFKQLDNDGAIIAIGRGAGGVEISETEYEELLYIFKIKAALVEELYNNNITLEEVPNEWKEEIERRVDKLKQLENEVAGGEEE